MTKPIVKMLTFSLLLALPATARADRPYVVLTDDGTIESTSVMTENDIDTITGAVLTGYAASGAPLPEILSVWTAFPIGGDSDGTYFDPIGSEVTGIGLEQDYGAPFASTNPPLTSILLHNNVTQIAARAALAGAPTEGYASYLFLLELGHTWGPSVRIPGNTPTELEGFSVHWSFFLDAGNSPIGGNLWHDNGDGTFSTEAQTPAGVRYSMLDLYLMGLASPMEVTPFGVLETPVLQGASANVMDGLWGGALAAHSFPWFGAQPIVVKATRKALTISDIVTTNGMRMPAFGASQTSWKLGIVLVLPKGVTAMDAASIEAAFDPIASSFAPAFSTATQGRGTLEVVTPGAPPSVDAGADASTDGATAESVDSGTQHSSDKGGCAMGGHTKDSGLATLLLALSLTIPLLRRKRAR